MMDRLMKLYELNQKYHDTKEKMAWLATTFYAGFSLAVIKAMTIEKLARFLYNHHLFTWAIVVLLAFIAICVFSFCRFQYKKKRASQKIDVNIRQELSSYNEDDQKQVVRVFDFMDTVHNEEPETKKKANFTTERPIFALMYAFASAQVAFVLVAANTRAFF